MNTSPFELKAHSKLLEFLGFDQVVAEIGADLLLRAVNTSQATAPAHFLDVARTTLGEDKGKMVAQRWASYTWAQQTALICMTDPSLLQKHVAQHIVPKLQGTGALEYAEDWLRFETHRCECIKILHGADMYANSAEENFKFLLSEAVQENLSADERQVFGLLSQALSDLKMVQLLCGTTFLEACAQCSRARQIQEKI